MDTDNLSRFRFKGGVMKGLLVSSAPTDYLQWTVANMRAGTDTAKACRAELAKREAERVARREGVERCW